MWYIIAKTRKNSNYHIILARLHQKNVPFLNIFLFFLHKSLHMSKYISNFAKCLSDINDVFTYIN